MASSNNTRRRRKLFRKRIKGSGFHPKKKVEVSASAQKLIDANPDLDLSTIVPTGSKGIILKDVQKALKIKAAQAETA